MIVGKFWNCCLWYLEEVKGNWFIKCRWLFLELFKWQKVFLYFFFYLLCWVFLTIIISGYTGRELIWLMNKFYNLILMSKFIFWFIILQKSKKKFFLFWNFWIFYYLFYVNIVHDIENILFPVKSRKSNFNIIYYVFAFNFIIN